MFRVWGLGFRFLNKILDPHSSRLLNPKPYLEGRRDLVSGFIMGVTGVTIWVLGVISILAKYP